MAAVARTRLNRGLWIAAAVALLLLLLWFAVRAFRAGSDAPATTPPAAGAATSHSVGSPSQAI